MSLKKKGQKKWAIRQHSSIFCTEEYRALLIIAAGDILYWRMQFVEKVGAILWEFSGIKKKNILRLFFHSACMMVFIFCKSANLIFVMYSIL